MIQPSFQFCPRCAGKLVVVTKESTQVHQCSVCGFVFYQNQNVTVAAIIVREGKLLFTRRKVAPYLGMLDLAGGFVEPEETPQAGMLREIHEELGVEGTIVAQLGIFGPDTYEFGGMTVYNSSALFQVDIGKQTPAASDDAASLEWHDLATLDLSTVAFPGLRECLSQIAQGKISLL